MKTSINALANEMSLQVLKPVTEWFCRYLDWEEGNVLLDKR